ncbi:MAG: xanthine dehydrogenase family protein subunit M [Pseudomonadota bacterium]
MYAFSYRAVTSIEEAVAALKADEEAKFLAGGMTILPTMKIRLASPTQLIALDKLPQLVGVSREDNALVIGAMTRHAQVAGDVRVRETIPALACLASQIGDPQVRNRGTLGGSVANNDPAADYPAALLGLGATVYTDRRAIGADDFFTGMFETALAPDELVVRVSFPIPTRAAYAKFPNPASGYAVVGVMVAQTSSGTRVAVTGAGQHVFRVPQMERALGQRFSEEVLTGIGVPAEVALNEDLHASAAYRSHLVGVMARRAVAAAGG